MDARGKKGIRRVKVTELAKNRVRLWGVNQHHRAVVDMLREFDEWFRVAQLRQKKLERSAALKKLVAEEARLRKQRDNLRSLIAKGISSKTNWQHPGEWEGRVEYDWEKLKELAVYEGRFRDLIGLGAGSVHLEPSSQCQAESVWKPLPELQSEVVYTPDYLPSERYCANINSVVDEQDRFSGLLFGDVFVDASPLPTDNGSVYVQDVLSLAAIFTYEYEAPCKGRVRYYFQDIGETRLELFPSIGADARGSITVYADQLLHKDGDGLNPLEVWMKRTKVDVPDRDDPANRVLQTRVVYWPLFFGEVLAEKGEKVLLHITVSVHISAQGGLVSFVQDDGDAIGQFLFWRKPGGMNTPGVVFTFNPE